MKIWSQIFGFAAQAFKYIQTDSGTTPTAETPDDTLTLTSSDGSISIVGDQSNDSVDFTVVGGGSGDVTGPGSSTDNAVARFDGTTGKVIQNSVVTVGDTGAVAGVSTLNMSGQLTNTVATGTAPLVVSSTTLVSNFNADSVDGAHVGTTGGTIPKNNTTNIFSAQQTIRHTSSPLETMNQLSTTLSIDYPTFFDFRSLTLTAQSSGTWYPIQYWNTFSIMSYEYLCRASVQGVAYASATGYEIFVPIVTEDCFLPGTLVNTPSGMVAIETLKDGDEVYSKNIETGEIEINEVEKVLIHDRGGQFAIINEKIRCTNHRIFVNDEWTKVGFLKVGDYLRSINGEKVWVYSIEYVDNTLPFQTYNLKMRFAGCPNYFVNDVLVHNKCPFLYSFNKELTQPWVYENTFLYELDSKEKATTQRRKLKTLTNKFYIREIEPETSCISDMALIAVSGGVEHRLERVNKGGEIVTKHRDIVPVEFEALPDGTEELYVEATGYYVWEG